MSARSTETANEHLPPPRALFFDLDDTLAGFTSARHAASRTVAEQIAAAVPGVSAQEIVAQRRARGAALAQAANLEPRRRQVWADVLRAVGAEGRFEPAELTALHDRLTQKRLALFPDAAPTLSRAATALDDLDVEPREAVVVGNSPTHDVAGALRSGWRAVWLNRGNEPYPDGLPRPSAVISTLTDLFDLFGGG